MRSALQMRQGRTAAAALLGLVIAAIGLVWVLAPAVPWLGRLPGDIRIESGNFRFYFSAHDVFAPECWVDAASLGHPTRPKLNLGAASWT
jgi:hypothetical protein